MWWKLLNQVFILMLAMLSILIATNSPGQETSVRAMVEPPEGLRDKLTSDDLLNGNFPQLVHNDYFLPVGDTLPPATQLSGIIHFSETLMSTSHPNCDWKGCGQRLFPAFSLPVVSSQGHFIPLERGIIYSGDTRQSFWNIIVSPGRVWQEPGDNGYCRASFPFTLTDNYIGQARNGIATFIYNSAEISSVAVQITQETCPLNDYIQADFHGIIPATYVPQQFADEEYQILIFRDEMAKKIQVHSWSELPLSGFTQSFYNGGLPPEAVSTAALLLDGWLYLQKPETRTGPYPYPEEMRHGVFSVTKTLGMGLAMFYAAERYGEAIFHELITDYVPMLSDHPGWQGVTFEHALCMATGVRASSENQDLVPLILARTAKEKLATIRDHPDAPLEPGQQFIYHSTNTFVLSCALNQYVKAREGPEADYWLMVTEDILKPLGIEYLPITRTIEEEGKLGTPVMGWGSYPNIQETAKIGRLLHDEGNLQGKQVLCKNKVREGLYRTSRTGYSAGYRTWYLHSFWIEQMILTTGSIYAPSMAGAGGNRVVIMPSGTIAIRFGDWNYSKISHMVAVAEFYENYH